MSETNHHSRKRHALLWNPLENGDITSYVDVLSCYWPINNHVYNSREEWQDPAGRIELSCLDFGIIAQKRKKWHLTAVCLSGAYCSYFHTLALPLPKLYSTLDCFTLELHALITTYRPKAYSVEEIYLTPQTKALNQPLNLSISFKDTFPNDLIFTSTIT